MTIDVKGQRKHSDDGFTLSIKDERQLSKAKYLNRCCCQKQNTWADDALGNRISDGTIQWRHLKRATDFANWKVYTERYIDNIWNEQNFWGQSQQET